ncbi:hypothetical protein [Bifidobacterium colobi]|uniref:hypothetical protein n=1 Tax=Bifidobacterium colobi TaxID=2809026 RepID=UPI001F0B11D3|nr:hypothetical protein [Bifidobacterium colobi]
MAEEQVEQQSSPESGEQTHDTDRSTAKPNVPAQRTYSEEDVNRIVKERLARERAKKADYDEFREKAGKADELQSELEKSKAETAELRAKVEQAEHEKQLANIRSNVAAKYGIADPTMNRKSAGLDLTPETQAEIWQKAAYQSAFMQLVPQINLPGKGVRVPIITGDPVGSVALKPVSHYTIDPVEADDALRMNGILHS